MIKRLIASLTVAVLILLSVPLTAAAWDPFGGTNGVCTQSGTANSAVCSGQSKTNPLIGPKGIITSATHIVAFVAGVAAVILLIIGGIRYVTSNGDSNNINSAKNTVLYALVGLVVVVFAQTLIVYVVSKL